MSPQIFKTLLRPFYQEYFEFVKSKTEAKIFYHSCGNVTEFIDELVDNGVEIINPVQVAAMVSWPRSMRGPWWRIGLTTSGSRRFC